MPHGKPVSWDDFDLQSQRRIIASVRKSTGATQEQAEDAVADAAAKLVSSGVTAENPKALLTTSARNALLSARRRQDRFEPLSEGSHASARATPDAGEEDDNTNGDSDLELRELQDVRKQRVGDALRKLSEADRKVLEDQYFEGQSPASVDAAQGARHGTTKHKVHRARRRLRAALAAVPSHGSSR